MSDLRIINWQRWGSVRCFFSLTLEHHPQGNRILILWEYKNQGFSNLCLVTKSIGSIRKYIGAVNIALNSYPDAQSARPGLTIPIHGRCQIVTDVGYRFRQWQGSRVHEEQWQAFQKGY